MRKINKAGLDLIKFYEGFHKEAYRCPAGIWTIGYGHTKNVKPTDRITLQDAEELLEADCGFAEKSIEDLVKVSLTDNQFSALVSFVFNVGARNFEKSTLLKLLNRGWYEQVPIQLLRWNKVNNEVLGGLTRRRVAEGSLWRS